MVMSNGSMWGLQLGRAKDRARKKYPNQPERARQMCDKEMGVYDGPYNLEPLNWFQKIQLFFDDEAHVRS